MAKMCVRVNSTYMEFTLTQEVELELRNTFKFLFFFFLFPCFICAKNERMFDIIIQTHVRFVNTRFSFFWISKYLCPLYNPVICFRRQTVDQNIKNCKSQIYTNCTIPVQLCILHIECFQKISDHWKCNCHMNTRCH